MNSQLNPEPIAFVDLNLQWTAAADLRDPVDLEVARFFGERRSRGLDLLAFGWQNGSIQVATAWPMKPGAAAFLSNLEFPVVLFRADRAALRRAQTRAFGRADVDDGATKRFGELAVLLGKTDQETVAAALAYQEEHGGRLGQILVALNSITFWDLAEILARQFNLPRVSLMDAASPSPSSPRLWQIMPKEFWYRHHIVPLDDDGDALTVAVEDPGTLGLIPLAKVARRRVDVVVTGRRDILTALEDRYALEDLAVSRDWLAQTRPNDSAQRLLTSGQVVALVALLGALVAAAVWHLVGTLAVLSSLLIVAYALVVGYRFWFVNKSTGHVWEKVVSQEEMDALDDRTLPRYTLLIPVRDEVSVLPTLTRALAELDYPKDRLDVKLLVEQDDADTVEAALQGRLPGYMEIVRVPVQDPRTKPKACNYGLQRARGEYLSIFDAEDIPEPDQLKKAVVLFRREKAEVACIQAKLSYFNRDQNLLTRWFTAEYAAWFDLYLPALHVARLPVPLGGSSNHFRTKVLREIGGWDPFNVTEDADLGIRLHRAGYRTAVMDSTTYEEANSEFVNWVRQRSRWVKGYLQTWLVHMRHPVALYRELGPGGFWGFQMTILGTPLMFLLNPIYWLLTTLWFATQWGLVGRLFPPGIYYIGMINLLGGNFIFTYLNAIASARRGDWELVKYSLLSPLYWSMMSLASWKAMMQLVMRPSHWEKTAHGLVDTGPYARVGQAFGGE